MALRCDLIIRDATIVDGSGKKVDLEGRIESWNSQLERLIGVTRHAAVRYSGALLKRGHVYRGLAEL